MGTKTESKTNKHLSAEEKAAKKAKKAAKAALKEKLNETEQDSLSEKKEAKKAKKEKRKRASDEDLDFFAPKEVVVKKSRDEEEEKSDDIKKPPSPPPRGVAAAVAEQEMITDGRSFRALHNITLFGILGATPEPILDWNKTPFPQFLVQPLVNAGFVTPSPIQATCWPIMLSGRDTIAIAKTGSGKTLGFLLPAFMHLSKVRPNKIRGDAPKVLVLAPTRELACQIQDECNKFGQAAKVRSTCCYGGAPKSTQIRALQAGIDILVATPGRLNDLLEMRRANVSQVDFLVFDEADRMLDMGFEPQIREVLKYMTPNSEEQPRQTLFFTATWPKNVQSLAKTFLNNPVQINIGKQDSLSASKSITQTIHVLKHNGEKWDMLIDEMKKIKVSTPEYKLLIFSATKVGCNEVADSLWQLGESVDSLHGDKQQWERTKVLDKFRSHALSIVVCTDVAARGLDIDGVTHVINYDFPAGTSGVEDYVHRIGRTGRGNKTGHAITFFTSKDSRSANELLQVMKKADQIIPPELEALGGKGGKGGKGFGGRGGKGFGGRGGGKGRRW
mmetsp:Transcript_7769/g.10080  ORF Transcript_7769/g.10080 Transcript_7769/m.10080 type:complete len:559 (-) Transcript_7769:244-1920(-)